MFFSNLKQQRNTFVVIVIVLSIITTIFYYFDSNIITQYIIQREATIEDDPENVKSSSKYLSLLYYQSIINDFIDELSSQNYSQFNDDIIIDGYNFNHFSTEFLIDSLSNKSILICCDSMSKYLMRFVTTQSYFYDFYLGGKYNEYNNHTLILLNAWNKGLISDLLGWNDFELYYFQQYLGNNKFKVIIPWGDGIFSNHKAIHFHRFNITFQFLQKWIAGISTYKFFDDELKKFKKDINVIISNFAVGHIVHLHPWREPERNSLHWFINLEVWFDKFIESAIKYHKHLKCIIFKPPNPTCKDPKRYDEDYQEGARFWMNQSLINLNIKLSPIKTCLQKLNITYNQTLYNEYNESVFKGIDMCSLKNTMTESGSIFMNKRFANYVYRKQKEIILMHPNLKLIYYDNYKLYLNANSVCRTQIHFPLALPIQGMALSNIIHMFC